MGKLRHLDTRSLWVQDALRQRRVIIEQVKGTENPADLMTKHVDGAAMDAMLERIGGSDLERQSSERPIYVEARRRERRV